MATKINPKFSNELKKYGAVNMNACYNCGTCTAVCSLSTTDDSFPREWFDTVHWGSKTKSNRRSNRGNAITAANAQPIVRKQPIRVN
jgi:heterodisulfide reductase subunit C